MEPGLSRGRRSGNAGGKEGRLPRPSTFTGSIFPPAAPLQLSARRGPELTGIILEPNRMGAAGASPVTRSGERRPGERRDYAAAGTTCCEGRPARPSLTACPPLCSHREQLSHHRLRSETNPGPARRSRRAPPAAHPREGPARLLPPPGVPARSSTREAGPPGARYSAGTVTTRDPWESLRVTSSCTQLPIAPVSGPHGEQGRTQSCFPWIGSAGGKPPAKIRLQQ